MTVTKIAIILSSLLFCTNIFAVEPFKPSFEYYDVQGTNYDTLWKSIEENRPNGHTSANEWQISWNFGYSYLDGVCSLYNPKVMLTMKIILPRWTDPHSGSEKMQAEWKRYLKALIAHQMGHVKNAEDAQAEVQKALDAIPGGPKCDPLGDQAKTTARSILKKYDTIEADYETKTLGGATQGATLKDVDA
jgi:predicted secreted Zn-dependent protease